MGEAESGTHPRASARRFLRRVDDLVAAATAQHFYAGLLHDRLSIAQSVRYAALETRRDLRDGLPELPMLWAAHVAIGDASHRVGDGRAD